MSDVQLSANRTMSAYLRALMDADLNKARAILEGTITNPPELSVFIECLSGFALALMHIAEGLASAAGSQFDGASMLDDLTNKLAMASTIDDVLPDHG